MPWDTAAAAKGNWRPADVKRKALPQAIIYASSAPTSSTNFISKATHSIFLKIFGFLCHAFVRSVHLYTDGQEVDLSAAL